MHIYKLNNSHWSKQSLDKIEAHNSLDKVTYSLHEMSIDLVHSVLD